MSILGEMVDRGLDKNALIKDLIRLRIKNDPMAAAMGFGNENVNSLPELLLAGLPEATIATIVETWAILHEHGVSDAEIFFRIEKHRSRVFPVGQMPEPVTLANYVKYRLDLEHSRGAPIDALYIDAAVEAAKKAYSAHPRVRSERRIPVLLGVFVALLFGVISYLFSWWYLLGVAAVVPLWKLNLWFNITQPLRKLRHPMMRVEVTFPPTMIGVLSNIVGAATIGGTSGAIAGFFGDSVASGVISGAIAGAVVGAILGCSPTPADGPRIDYFSGWGYGGLIAGLVSSFVTDSSWLGFLLSCGFGFTFGLAIPAIFIALTLSRFKP